MKKLNTQTVLLVIILLITLMNGCQTCTTKNIAAKNTSKINTAIERMDTQRNIAINDFNILGDYVTSIIESVENNAEMVLILEKETDDQRIKSSGIKQLVNEYRK